MGFLVAKDSELIGIEVASGLIAFSTGLVASAESALFAPSPVWSFADPPSIPSFLWMVFFALSVTFANGLLRPPLLLYCATSFLNVSLVSTKTKGLRLFVVSLMDIAFNHLLL